MSTQYDEARRHALQVLDGAALDQLDSFGILMKVGKLYLELAPKILEEACTAIERGDLEMVRRACHNLKSSSANVGAIELSDICRQIENAAKQGQIEECKSLQPAFMDCHLKSRAALRECLAATRSNPD